MALQYGGLGVGPTLRGQPSNVYALQPCEAQLIPAGTWLGKLGYYTNYQVLDQVTGIWRNVGDGGITQRVESDGVNHRLCNQTGGTVGALITNGGSGYTSPPIVTASAGASVWQAIVGGAVNTTVTVSAGGSGYVYPPQIAFSAPGTPGIQATGYATISAGALATIVVTNQGAGYTAAPVVSVINDARDTTGTGGAAVAVTTGAGAITGLLATDHGNPLTAVPTLAFSGGGGSAAAATAIMCWSITAITTTGGAGYTVGVGAFQLSAVPMYTAGTATLTNTATQVGLVRMRPAIINVATIATGAPTTTGTVVIDGGIYQNVPTAIVIENLGLYPTQATLGLTMGGINDFTQLYPV